MPNPEVLRVWRRVEASPATSLLEQQWREILGEDYSLLQPFLKPESDLATSYPCPDPVHENCPRRIVQHKRGAFVAACGNASAKCDTINLHRSDLVVWSLRRQDWMDAVVNALQFANGLRPIDLDTPEGVVPLGTLTRGRQQFAVVWVRRAVNDLEYFVRGIRDSLKDMGLVVVLPPGGRRVSDRVIGAERIVLLTPPKPDDGRLDLYRALYLLDPGYRDSLVADPDAIFDDIRIEFFVESGMRHIVRINGQTFDGFEKSHLKFARILLLAAARAADPDIENGGWIQKSRLLGGEDRDRDLERLRAELGGHPHPDLSHGEMKALIKSRRGKGEIRLAVRPGNIRFDESLRDLVFISAVSTTRRTSRSRRTPGMDQLRRNLDEGLVNARLILKSARKLGVLPPAL